MDYKNSLLDSSKDFDDRITTKFYCQADEIFVHSIKYFSVLKKIELI